MWVDEIIAAFEDEEDDNDENEKWLKWQISWTLIILIVFVTVDAWTSMEL